MVFSAEPVVVNNGGICCVSGCASCCAIPSHWVEITVWMLYQWVWIMVSYAEAVVVNHGEVCWVSGCAIVRYAAPVVVNHDVLCWSIDCESLRIMLSQWLWIIVYYAELNLWESWCVMLSQQLWIIVLCWAVCVGIKVCYSDSVVVNHAVNAMSVGVNYDELCWTSSCEPLLVLLSLWLWNIVSYTELSV